ncbi:hypothetical protein BaRGS_00018821 [Batillaria attramentaria]|uniref:Uncharacterized protein n=1 Tax=Batillaria attramentaria TaxID=370345 RepID=A0ABD0KRN1_9CAEN
MLAFLRQSETRTEWVIVRGVLHNVVSFTYICCETKTFWERWRLPESERERRSTGPCASFVRRVDVSPLHKLSAGEGVDHTHSGGCSRRG